MATDELSGLRRRAQEALNQGQLSEARQICEQILARDPGHADGHFLLGMALAAAGKVPDALKAVEKAVGITTNAEYLAHLARLLSLLRRNREAQEVAVRSAKLRPEEALTLDTIGCVHSRVGDHEQAIPFFEKAVAKQPGHPQFRFNLATSLRFLADFDGAEAHYEHIIETSPNFVKAHTALSSLAKQTPERNHTGRLEKLLARTRHPAEQLHIRYALAKEYEDLGDGDRAFSHLETANRQRKAELEYSVDFDQAIFEAIQAPGSGRDVLWNGEGDPSDEPIFIIGMPRTGTTLVERIISSHPDVCSAGELQAFPVCLKRLSGSRTKFVLDADVISLSRNVAPRELGARYLEETELYRDTSPRFIDKMPLNFFNVGFIARALPKATIICLRRNPMDTCWSNFKHLFATNFSYYNYSYDLLDTARYYAMFDALMAFWRERLPGLVLEVQYEDLINTQEAETRRILGHCGLSWAAECLNFHENPSAVATPSAVQVRQPIYRGSVAKWRHFEKQLKPVCDYFAEQGISVGKNE